MDDSNSNAQRIEDLKAQHRELDDEIARLIKTQPHDQIKAQRLKKKKLALKDQISRLETAGFPDIIA